MRVCCVSHNIVSSQHAGDIPQAYAHLDRARQLDLADRYLNTKAAIYALRAGQMQKAIKLAGLFLKVSICALCWLACVCCFCKTRGNSWGEFVGDSNDLEEEAVL